MNAIDTKPAGGDSVTTFTTPAPEGIDVSIRNLEFWRELHP